MTGVVEPEGASNAKLAASARALKWLSGFVRLGSSSTAVNTLTRLN